MFLTLLCCILCTIYPVYMSRELDQQCIDNCSCCKEEICGPRIFPNSCSAGCIDGHRGNRCYELCQYENCKSCGFNTNSIDCDECYDGYYLGRNKDCTLPCPLNCKSCISSTMCTECKEGFYDENGSTTCKYALCPANCECTIGQKECVSCKNGFYDTPSSCSRRCPVNCFTCQSKESCNECKNGFYNGFKFDNNINLQLNNCSYTCRDTCTQCRSYSNCLQCIKGKYGPTCQENCSVGCEDKTCLFDSGHCECTANFTGDNCMKCVNGKYGLFCNQTCSRYCRGIVCERHSGECTGGCLSDNMIGNTCSTCRVGLYGESCNINCSKNCRNRRCEKLSGKCSEGCIGNFLGTMCDMCIKNKYGENCELDCPVNCGHNICEKTSGFCYACTRSFYGPACKDCMPGYYGPSCNETCSPYCASNRCDRTTGKCIFGGCKLGYSGDRCCVKSNHCLVCNDNVECKKCACGFYTNVCNERCSDDCLGPCDISTGECSYCPFNRFGKFCEFNCSQSCKFDEGVYEKVCARSDGACINGCNDGYFSSTCNETCSSFCAGGACRQDDGICLYGCDSHQEKPECVFSEKQKTAEGGTGKTFIILFVMATIIIILQAVGLFIICKKRRGVVLREASERQSGVFYENMQMNTAPPLSQIKETNVASANRPAAYEDVNRTPDEAEDYEQISIIQVKM